MQTEYFISVLHHICQQLSTILKRQTFVQKCKYNYFCIKSVKDEVFEIRLLGYFFGWNWFSFFNSRRGDPHFPLNHHFIQQVTIFVKTVTNRFKNKSLFCVLQSIASEIFLFVNV